MKKLILASVLVFLSACSFKKNSSHNTENVVSSDTTILKKVAVGNESDVLTIISDIKNRSSGEHLDNQLFEIALKRGNPSIVKALLINGFSPYRESITYQYNNDYDSESFKFIKQFNWEVISDLDLLINKNNFEIAQQHMSELGMSCETLMDLHSQYSLGYIFPWGIKIQKSQLYHESFLKFIGTLENCNLHESNRKDFWLENEVIRISYVTNFEDVRYFNFLVSLYDKATFNFKNKDQINLSYFMKYQIDQLQTNDRSKMTQTWLKPLSNILASPDRWVTSLDEYKYNFKPTIFLDPKDDVKTYIDNTFFLASAGSLAFGPEFLLRQLDMITISPGQFYKHATENPLTP